MLHCCALRTDEKYGNEDRQIILHVLEKQGVLGEKWHVSGSFMAGKSEFPACKVRLSLAQNPGYDKGL